MHYFTFADKDTTIYEVSSSMNTGLDEVLEVHGGIAVMVSAKHLCACLRGVKHPHSEMKTSKLSGAFRDGDYSVRQEFYNFVKDMK